MRYAVHLGQRNGGKTMSDERPVDGDCGTCRWWVGEKRRDPLLPKFGTCHGGPPAVNPNDSSLCIWPRTKPDDWCARFERKRDDDG